MTTRSIVLDTMRCNTFFILFVLSFSCAFAQVKNEREFRIKPSELPKTVETQLTPHMDGAKRIRYYQEIDGEKKSFEAKFKKGRLRYSVEFDELGALEDAEFIIGKTDIPNETWSAIENYLGNEFKKFTIKKIQQQYPVADKSSTQVLKEAFQNLILPYINYELVVSGKKNQVFEQFEILFDSDGTFLSIRKSIRPKYDHVLY